MNIGPIPRSPTNYSSNSSSSDNTTRQKRRQTPNISQLIGCTTTKELVNLVQNIGKTVRNEFAKNKKGDDCQSQVKRIFDLLQDSKNQPHLPQPSNNRYEIHTFVQSTNSQIKIENQQETLKHIGKVKEKKYRVRP